MEFVIESSQRDVVYEYRCSIEEKFNVRISITNGTGAKVWIKLEGGKTDKAKSYIRALTNAEQREEITIPPKLYKILGPRSKEHFELESEYGVVIQFPHENKAVIIGDMMEVTMAASKLEDLITKYSSNFQTKRPQSRENRALKEFALKLGYDPDQINMVFENLGPSVDQNTFLNELIKTPKTGEDRRLPMTTRSTSRQVTNPSPMSGGLNNHIYHGDTVYLGDTVYHGDTGVLSRSAIKSPAPKKYVNRPCNTANNIDLGVIPLQTDIAVTRGHIPNVVTSPPAAYMPRTTVPSSHNVNPSNVISRGFVPRTVSQSTNGSNTTTSGSDWMNNAYIHPGNEYGSLYEPQQFDQLLDQMTSKYQQLPQSNLRHVVIDGSNVAMSHGNNKIFSCRGIAICINWFLQRGHNQITVFVPSWRKESAKIDNPITDQHVLKQLEDQGFLTYTPSRKVKGRRIVCYDDRFIIRLAERTDGIIVSNDNFKDLAGENPKWREVIEQRLLMYSFVSDMFMPPDDPLGRHGPTLDEFLQKGTPVHRRLCPYGRRCTYGTRCKYHHPEREENRHAIFQNLKVLFPNQEALILNVMKKFPHEKDADKLAGHILSLMH